MAKRVAALAVLAGMALSLLPSRVQLPEHLLGHPALFLPNLLTPEQADGLMDLSKKFGDFPTNVADLNFYNTTHEHIGEAVPMGANGTCDHMFLVPSRDRKLCHLPGRIDIGKHYLTTGGVEALKELPQQATTRLLSFGRYMFNPAEYPIAAELFASDKFQAAARSVCPASKPILDPFQFNLIIQVPGQTVAVHVDAVYFVGASRFQFPQWLLAVMKFSGLFEDRFVDQVQVVAYYHRWQPKPETGGQFVWWNESGQIKPHSINPEPLAGSAVDGSKTVHAASVYQPGTVPPALDKSIPAKLRYLGDERWQVESDGQVLRNYTTEDLRMTIVYRARCFASAADIEEFQSPSSPLDLPTILDTLKDDMANRTKWTRENLDALEPLALAQRLLENYVRYPLPANAIVPFNWCALTKLWPWTEPVLKWVC
eukprot:m.486638 g.486638  ORF g.486638 m.486638 type:complete len:427 (+) comp24527_c0_seq1:33-1313(+)